LTYSARDLNLKTNRPKNSQINTKGECVMTKTIQPCSCETTIDIKDNDMRKQKSETEDNRRLLLTLSNNLNNLYENINRLNYEILKYVNQKKRLEQIFNTIKTKEE
jgi:small-conductance mechanosensitive channel